MWGYTYICMYSYLALVYVIYSVDARGALRADKWASAYQHEHLLPREHYALLHTYIQHAINDAEKPRNVVSIKITFNLCGRNHNFMATSSIWEPFQTFRTKIKFLTRYSPIKLDPVSNTRIFLY